MHKSMEMENSDYDSNISIPRGSHEIAITIRDVGEFAQPPFPTSTPRLVPFHNHRGILYLLYAGAIVVMYPSLAQLAQLKFQNKQSPFETHGFLTNTAVVAYIIAIPTSVLSFYMKAHLQGMIKERFSPAYYVYTIIKFVFCFFGILAPLSLVLVLLIPHELNSIGYSIIFALFVMIIACNFSDYIKSLCKKDVSSLGALQDVSSSRSIVTISD